ncbi:MAG: ATP-dependent helicase [Clostridia bacterium]|nr:ATP-dependent helicase [Clostridia bacterium]
MQSKVSNDILDNHIDDHVDVEIQRCFNKQKNKSFFVFAGAGSGKTTSLVNTLKYIEANFADVLSVHSQKVAVITYTNAACDEIISRIDDSSMFSVQTIHSFLWDLIKNMQNDIKVWLTVSIKNEIEELEEQQAKSKKGVTFEKRLRKIEEKRKRLERIEVVKRFRYNPNGENLGYDSLNHAEVVKMGSEFIMNRPMMQKILISQYPILLIDESQDTKKELVDALIQVFNNSEGKIIIGMFGDTMQRIYLDGKENLEEFIPEEWIRPNKIMNHRSAKRIVELANSIRKDMDGKIQKARLDAPEGNVVIFVCDKGIDKAKVEEYVVKTMSKITGDNDWTKETKKLILEHHMAASRLGFKNFFAPIYEIDQFKTGILDGSLAQLKIFTSTIIPLIKAHNNKNLFEEMKIIRKYSPLLSTKNFSLETKNQRTLLQNVRKYTDELYNLWCDDKVPNCLEVLKVIKNTGLFEIPTELECILIDGELTKDEQAIKESLSANFDELVKYEEYISGSTQFATHQGVKGLEFPRVMVILDDEEAKGFLFSYEKLFGAKELSEIDMKNAREGKDNSISRTTRLFYVACTRAERGLAVVAYTENVEKVISTLMANKWFHDNEINVINQEELYKE